MTFIEQKKIEARAAIVITELQVLQFEFRKMGMPISADKIGESLDKIHRALAESRKGIKS